MRKRSQRALLFAVMCLAGGGAIHAQTTPPPPITKPRPGVPVPVPSPLPPRTAPPITRPELRGIADPHAHLMAHEGFGGRLFWGQPEGSHDRALAHCGHGPAGVSINPEATHLVGGFPEFDGWPRFTTLVHQQAHVDWIRRAFDGGLRLVSMLAVNNQLLAARFDDSRYPLDDRSAIDRQIAAMRRMAANNAEWMEIATSPSEARRIIGRGKLAVILGIEVDSLGNWRTPAALPADPAEARRVIRAEVQRLFDLGVRQITPIHLSDNAFGGCAIYNRFFDANNKHLTGRHYEVEEGWPTGIRYRLDRDTGETVPGYLSLSLAYLGPVVSSPQWAGKRSHRNAKGLTPHGVILLEEMMRLRMIVDIDHLSEKALGETFEIMERARYPVLSSHTGFRDLAFTADVAFGDMTHEAYGTSDIHKIAHEGDKRAGDIERIRRLGGMVGVILNQGDVRRWRARILNDSAGSSKSWAQAYLYAVEKMGGQGVALASDINGLAGLPGPRFGTYASQALMDDRRRESRRLREANAQLSGVRYETPIVDYRRYRFEGPGEIYGENGDDIWSAVAIYKSRTDPDRADVPLLEPGERGLTINLAKGFWAAERGDRLEGRGALVGDTYAQQRAAFLVGRNRRPDESDPPETVRLYPMVKEVWDRWTVMEGPARTVPLTRSTAGRRDFDINLDGMAHYGMLPDFIQDLKNIGLTTADLEPLFKSAEHYIQMWERCFRAAVPVP